MHLTLGNRARAFTLLAVKYRLKFTWSWASLRSAAGWSFEASTF